MVRDAAGRSAFADGEGTEYPGRESGPHWTTAARDRTDGGLVIDVGYTYHSSHSYRYLLLLGLASLRDLESRKHNLFSQFFNSVVSFLTTAPSISNQCTGHH